MEMQSDAKLALNAWFQSMMYSYTDSKRVKYCRDCYHTYYYKHFMVNHINANYKVRAASLETFATSWLVLHWMCGSSQRGCAWRIIPICMWQEQAIIESSCWVISSCCLMPQCEALFTCRLAFQSQQNGTVTRMWRLFHVQPSQFRNMQLV